MSWPFVVIAIVTLAGGSIPRKRLERVRRTMIEISWLLSRRAVVFPQ